MNRLRGWLFNLVEHQGIGARLDVIDHVVETTRQGANLVALQRSNEGAREQIGYFVDDEIASVLHFGDLSDAALYVIEVLQQAVKELSRLHRVARAFVEPIEELDLGWKDRESS